MQVYVWMYTGLSGHETIGANQAIIFATAPVEILNILWTVHISQNGNSTSLQLKASSVSGMYLAALKTTIQSNGRYMR